MSGRTLYFNGINGATGCYLLPPIQQEELVARLREKVEAAQLERFKRLIERYVVNEEEKKRKPPFGGNPKDLSETGWGVVFASNVSRTVREALSPLLTLREEATHRRKRYYRVFDYHAGETAAAFLRRHDVRPNDMADPRNGVPYYLLLVGDPEAIPYRFQQELDVNYAVGRIHFPNVDDYRIYAESVKASETRKRLPRKVTIFGVRNEDDESTRQTADDLVEPLSRTLLDEVDEADEVEEKWSLRKLAGPEARREQLARLLGGPETPALLFTASHGVAFPLNDPRQLDSQGGLICQDWPGRKVAVRRDHYFTAEDLSQDANLKGLVAFFLACHSVGTPKRCSYYDESGETYGAQEQIAENSFVSRLCQKLLSHPNGGALAVLGHVDRALTSTFGGSGENDGIDNYRNCLRWLLEGHTVGWAMESFNYSHATTATKLSNLWQALEFQEDMDDEEFFETWRINNDAQGFAVFGDPAVKLSVKG